MAANVGWDINIRSSSTIGDLVDSLNQAAVDKVITFWGRKYEYDLGEAAKGTFPLVEIPVQHFVDGYTFSVINLFGDNAVNFYIITGKLGKMMREQRGEIYQDIHADRTQLTSWLNRNKRSQTSIASAVNREPYDQTLRWALEQIAASPTFGGEIDAAPDELRQAARAQ
jgi:sensor domain CHASE-containing protein